MKKLFLISLALVCMASVSATAAGKQKATTDQDNVLVPEGSSIAEVIPADKGLLDKGFMVREYAPDCPVAVIANIAATIKLDTLYVFEIPLKQPAADVRWFGKAFFYADGNKICRSWEKGADYTLLEADAPVTKVFPAADGLLYSTAKSVVFCDYINKNGHVLHQSKKGVVLAGYINGDIFFADGKDVFLVSGNKKTKIYSDKRAVDAIAVHPMGMIFLSTDKGTFLLNDDYRRLQLSKKSAVAIDIIGDDLFLTFGDGSCIMIGDCSNYKKQLPK